MSLHTTLFKSNTLAEKEGEKIRKMKREEGRVQVDVTLLTLNIHPHRILLLLSSTC